MSTPTAAPTGSTPKTVTPKAPKPQKPKEDKPQKGKEDKAQKKDDAGAKAGTPAPEGETKLTPKQLKELKKAEKQARRAADKATAGVTPGGKPEVGAGGDKKGKLQQSAKGPSTEKKGGKLEKAEKGSGATAVGHAVTGKATKKEIPLFRHLESPGRRVNIAGSHKDVHPAILALALQMASYDICGSSARCVATLLAFKRVIDAHPVEGNIRSHYLCRSLRTTQHQHTLLSLATFRPTTSPLKLSTFGPLVPCLYPCGMPFVGSNLKSPPSASISLNMLPRSSCSRKLTTISVKKSPLQTKPSLLPP